MPALKPDIPGGKPMRVRNADDNPASDSDGSMDCATPGDTIDMTILEIITDGSMDATSTKLSSRLSIE
jgi:hypothetical protein